MTHSIESYQGAFDWEKKLLIINLKNYIFYWVSDSNGIRSHNHLVREQTLNHLAKFGHLAI